MARTFLRLLTTGAACLLVASLLTAQNGYLFEVVQPGVVPYVQMASETEVDMVDEDGWHTVTDLPEAPMWLFGTDYGTGTASTVSINANGHVRIGNDYTFASIQVARTLMGELTGGSHVSYRYMETAEGKILEVQYKNMVLLHGVAGNFMNAQLRIHLGTGMIEMHYGPSSESNGSGFTGDRGPHIGVYQSPTDFSSCMEKTWLSGNPDGPQVDYTANYLFPCLTGLPAPGTLYRFMPLFNIPNAIGENAASPFRMGATLVTDQLSVSVDEPAGMQLQITDTGGRILRSIRATSGMNTIDITDLAPGSYLVLAPTSPQRPAMRFVKM